MSERPTRMLIVEDELKLRRCLEEFFSARGFVVGSVFSGEEAIAQLTKEPADVVLLDILLPGLSGFEVLKRIKQRHPLTRVIVITGVNQEEMREAARRYGADAFITKPFDFSDATWFPAFVKAPQSAPPAPPS